MGGARRGSRGLLVVAAALTVVIGVAAVLGALSVTGASEEAVVGERWSRVVYDGSTPAGEAQRR